MDFDFSDVSDAVSDVASAVEANIGEFAQGAYNGAQAGINAIATGDLNVVVGIGGLQVGLDAKSIADTFANMPDAFKDWAETAVTAADMFADKLGFLAAEGANLANGGYLTQIYAEMPNILKSGTFGFGAAEGFADMTSKDMIAATWPVAPLPGSAAGAVYGAFMGNTVGGEDFGTDGSIPGPTGDFAEQGLPESNSENAFGPF